MLTSSRRSFVKGLVSSAAGAAILGFDPLRRSWITSALADTTAIAIPDLDGALLSDPATLAAFATDFGNYVHHTPVAVLKPASVEDVVRAIRFCREHGIPVATRGQGHSTAGQSQVQGGLVIDSSTLNEIEHIGDDHVNVQAGVRWIDLIAKTVPMGLTPPVLTGFTGLSVGGTLSMGGIGPACFQFGPQVDNVIELHVVTGEGRRRKCSAHENEDLFHAVLGGVGQYAVIVGAKLRLVAVAPMARNYLINYGDLATFYSDMNRLTRSGRVDGVYALIVPDGHGGWVYQLNAVKYFATGSPPNDAEVLEGLNFPPPALQATSMDTFTFDTLVDQLIAFLQSVGLVDIPHVWGDVFLPASRTESFVQTTLATLTPADLGPAGFVLLFPIRNTFSRELALRLPAEEHVFLFDLLSSGLPSQTGYVPTEVAKVRALFERARAMGGKLYPIGSTPMSKADWALQYGPVYGELVEAKRRYDPDGILTPGPGIF